MHILHKTNLSFTNESGQKIIYDKYFLVIDSDILGIVEIPIGNSKTKAYLDVICKSGEVDYEEF